MVRVKVHRDLLLDEAEDEAVREGATSDDSSNHSMQDTNVKCRYRSGLPNRQKMDNLSRLRSTITMEDAITMRANFLNFRS